MSLARRKRRDELCLGNLPAAAIVKRIGGQHPRGAAMRIFIWTVAIMMISPAAGAADSAAAAPRTANSSFAARLYQSVATPSDQNTFFSPASIAAAVAMTSTGARGETEKQMYAV